ncbi:MAG: LptF/LptG family permease [Candidatus Eisenbacteria bacterium]|nr:LptF/LptG family permease [Candidatus Eisenbacteria bacterium]
MMALLERYLLRQLLRPFLLGVFVITFLLTMDFLFDYLDLFLGKGIDLWTVLRLFVLGLGWMLALSIPCGVLVGMLMTFGRLSQDNEIVALRASGINLARLLAPAVGAAACVAIALTLFNNYVLPDMNHAFANLMLDVNKKRPTAQIQEGVFIDHFPGYRMWIGKLDDRQGRMEDILIFDASRKGEPQRTISAERGRLEFDPDRAVLTLHLEDGEIHQPAEESGTIYRLAHFDRQSFNIEGVRDELQRTRGRSRGQREMSIGAMQARIDELRGEREEHAARSREALEKIGIQSRYQLPGLAAEPPWYAPLARGLGLRDDPPPAPPDSFWTPQRRSLSEQAKVHDMQAQAATKKINQYGVEIHKKFSIPFACIVFTLLGAPLGIRARRGGLAAGFLSVVFFVFYYLCLIGGEQLADRRYAAPWIAMWLPNIVLGVAGLWLTLRFCEVRWGRRPSARKAVRRIAMC